MMFAGKKLRGGSLQLVHLSQAPITAALILKGGITVITPVLVVGRADEVT